MRRASRLISITAPLFFAAGSLAAQSTSKPLTVEAIFGHGALVDEPRGGFNWSPDSKRLVAERDGQLVELDQTTGKTQVLVSAVKLAVLTGGSDHAPCKLDGYMWLPDSAHLLINANNRLWLYDLRTGSGAAASPAGIAMGGNAELSPDGSMLSAIRDHKLTVLRLREAGAPTTVLASELDPHGLQLVLNGEVDWVYGEELDVRGNYAWSPDAKNFAYLQMDERQVAKYPLTDWIPSHAQVDWQRYPQPGDSNPAVRVGVIAVKGGKTVWVNLPIKPDQDYIPRFGWADSKTVWIETLSRDHKRRAIYFANAENGQSRQMLELRDEKFLDESYDVTVDNGAILLTSWSDGHSHIDLYSYNRERPLASVAKFERQLTKGDFEVSDIARVDTTRKVVDYFSTEGNPLEQQLWRVSFAGERKQLSFGAGSHSANLAPDGSAFIDRFSTRMEPTAQQLCRAEDSAHCLSLGRGRLVEGYNLQAPEQFEVKAHDGTTLYATLLLPAGAHDPASVPLIVNPYGGPHVQTMVNAWRGSLFFDELLAQHGFAVLHADNRGMGGRDRAFAQAAYRNLGPVQLEDQLTVIDATLARYPQLDAKRLGWWGWSWGGSFTIYAMTHSDRFRAGVAVAPVTDWLDYDSIYTERYMGLPSEAPQGYRDFSVVNSAAKLKGRLLVVHGTGDDNVHMENTVQFVQKLIKAGLPYDLQIYPRKTHSISGEDVRTHLYTRILAQFEQYLKPEVH
jgi:dipeptidyl-peptidase-4